ncbi:ABC transporter [Cellulomonas marina]|uniref:Predicted GTPase n=1 Tax=Cellulomonas marina TaxID=988821 RepID=A0A1I0V8E8_9CELL|nr:ABC transporter [Cellulomonas marina]GIG29237.1 hypothetical protein Cma02nite_18370 [Cellulomonas marina]SFA72333.1 Predicted GTPase [Cellulomonas marina]
MSTVTTGSPTGPTPPRPTPPRPTPPRPTPPGDDASAPRTAALLERAGVLVQALALGTDRWDPGTRTGVEAALTAVRDRLRLGVDHTVVLLAGGTGSGKSSLFNTVSGLPLAEVGVRRPTSSEVTACVWGRDAGPLLDRLGVHPTRRTQRESPLDGDAEAPLRGMVLLDVPDHDSVEGAHRALVDALLPEADLLVWVLDPQKYADDALHSGYLQRLAAHEVAALVVLNQADTVPAGARDALVADLERLLAEDGLDARVLAVSAVTGEGVGELRRVLAEIVAAAGLAARRAEGVLDEVAERLGAEVGRTAASAEADGQVDEAGEALVEELLDLSGARAGAVGPAAVPPPADAVALARRRWLARRTAGVPERWARDVDRRTSSAEDLVAATGRALADLPGLAPAARAWWARPVVGSALALVGALLLAVGLGVVLAGGLAGLPPVVGTQMARAGAVVLAGGVALLLVGRRTRTEAAAPPPLDEARGALATVVGRRLSAPARAVLDEHAAVRALLDRATRPL